jgi:hypothetical protein
MGYLLLVPIGAFITWLGITRAYRALKSGATWASGPGGFQQRTVTRTDEPNLFWLSVFTGGVLSVFGIVTAVGGVAASLDLIR